MTDIVNDMISDIGKEPVAVSPDTFVFTTPTPEPVRRRGRPPGSTNAPKNVGLPDDISNPLPKRGPGRPRKSTANPLTKDQLSRLIFGTHEAAGAAISPAAKIDKEQADAIAEAMLPVFEDFGLVVAGKVAHLIMLIAVVGMVEVPVAIAVATDARTKMLEARNRTHTIGAPAVLATVTPYDIARQVGVEVGAPG